MEEPSSRLDQIHLPRADGAASGAPTPARWAIKEEQDAPEDKDTVMRYGEDEGLGGDSLHDHDAPMGFGSSSSALHRFAPLPEPSMIHVKSPNKTKTSDRKTDSASPWSGAGRARGLAPPPAAVPLKNHKFADFRPWTGDGAEDALNADVIKNGFVDKPLYNVNSDANVTRSTIWPMMNNKGGLPLLSVLLVQAMDKRQALGKCTAPSTFKPPPRVTLTDTKREAWLRDLASTDVPLRRLSRTIPHGIRGKVLLEQCFSKNVPLARAIWLIKCVGANEIRAFRRKGISGPAALAGEVKWIRDWTLCVEQFVASTAANCGQKDWKRQIHSVIRLTAALYTENLLDQAHFLDWLIESFSASSLDMLPMWLLLVGLFWRQIIKVQRRGRTFCDAVVSQMTVLEANPQQTVLDTLRTSLYQYLVRLVSDHQACAIGLTNWPAAREVLRRARDQTGDLHLRRCFEDVLQRNDRLQPAQADLIAASKPARLVLFEYLDALSLDTPIEKCVERCLEICGDPNHLVAALVDWASSVYRTGHARVSLVVRLLTQLVDQGFGLEEGILSALADAEAQQYRDQTLFAKIVAEMTIVQCFNYGSFLQWLISTGAAWRRDPHCMALLFAVPLTSLTSQGLNLRSAILGRLGISAAAPAEDLRLLQMQFDQLVTEQQLLESEHVEGLLSRILDLQPCYRQILCEQLDKSTANLVSETLNDKLPMDFVAGHFAFVRTILETASEFGIMSTMLLNILGSAPSFLFAELVATVEQHADVFAAMGTMNTILPLLSKAYAFAKQTNNLDQVCIRSMIRLCRTQNHARGSVIKLENDLLTFSQLHAASVCSPASDSILTVQNGQINADEDIDRILASGNTMDEQMLARLFSAIVERTVRWTTTGTVRLNNPSRWFSLLRAFDNATFDRHMNLLISKLASSPGTEQVRAILISLVASGCLRLEDTLLALEKKLDVLEASSAPQLARFALGALQTFLPSSDLDHQSRYLEIYRFRTAQKQVCEQNRDVILRFVWHALAAPAEASALLFAKSTISWMSACCVAQPRDLQNRLGINGAADGHRRQQLMKLVLEMCSGAKKRVVENDFTGESAMGLDDMIKSSCELRLPFVQLLLHAIAASPITEQGVPDILSPMRAAIKSGNTLWPQLIDCAGIPVAAALRQESCASVIRAAESFTQSPGQQFDRRGVQFNLNVVSLTAHKVANEDLGVVDHVGGLLQALTKTLEDDSSLTLASPDLTSCIASLVELLISTTPIITPGTIALPSVQQILSLTCNLATNPKLQSSGTPSLLLDYATLLLHAIPLDTLPTLYKRLPADPRLRSLFAIIPPQKSPCLASRVPAPQPAPSATAPSATSPTVPSTPVPSTPGVPPTPGGRTRVLPRVPQETRFAPFAVRSWELMRDPTPNAGENDGSLSLSLFAARKV